MAAHRQIQTSETAKNPAPQAPFNDVSHCLPPGRTARLGSGFPPNPGATLPQPQPLPPPDPPSDFAFDSSRAQPEGGCQVPPHSAPSHAIPSRSAEAKEGR